MDDPEFQTLYRRTPVTNLWVHTGKRGPWEVLQNLLSPEITCVTLKKHLICQWSLN